GRLNPPRKRLARGGIPATIRGSLACNAPARRRRQPAGTPRQLKTWGGSSAGRALRSQCRGRGFDPLPLHQFPILRFVPIYPNGYAHGMKPIRFAGDALTELRAFPQAARHDAVANCTRSNVADNRTT